MAFNTFHTLLTSIFFILISNNALKIPQMSDQSFFIILKTQQIASTFSPWFVYIMSQYAAMLPLHSPNHPNATYHSSSN